MGTELLCIQPLSQRNLGLLINKKAVLSQRRPRDARYISRSWAVVEIWPFEVIQDGGGRLQDGGGRLQDGGGRHL